MFLAIVLADIGGILDANATFESQVNLASWIDVISGLIGGIMLLPFRHHSLARTGRTAITLALTEQVVSCAREHRVAARYSAVVRPSRFQPWNDAFFFAHTHKFTCTYLSLAARRSKLRCDKIM